MFCCPLDGTLLKKVPQTLDQVKVAILGVRSESGAEDTQGRFIVAGNKGSSSGDVTEVGNVVADNDNGYESSQFAPVGISISNWARNLVEADDSEGIFRGWTF